MRLDRHLGLGLAMIVLHFLWVAPHVEPAISGPDMGGYFLQARQLVDTGHTWIAADSPLQAPAMQFVAGEDGALYSKYPPGYPLLLAVPLWLFGAAAPLWIDPLLTAAMLLGLLLLGRRWLGRGWALLPVALLAVTPQINEHALGGFSHTAVAALLMWALYGYVRWVQDRSVAWAATAGVCLGAIPTVRYAEVLFVLGFGLVAWQQAQAWRRERLAGWWHGLAAATGAGAVPVACLAARNQAAFGAFWRTGYATTSEQTGFAWSFFLDHWHSYLTGLAAGNGLVFGLALVGIVVWLTQPERRRDGVLLLTLIVPTTLLYCAYYWNADSMSQRFLLPTYPLYALVAAAALRALAAALGRSVRPAVAVLVGVSILWGVPASQRSLARTEVQRRILAQVTAFVRTHVDPGAVLFADRSVTQQLMYAGAWRIAESTVLSGKTGARGPLRAGRRLASRAQGPATHGQDRWLRRRSEREASGMDASQPRPMDGPPAALFRYADLHGTVRIDSVAADLDRWTGVTPTYVLADSERAAEMLAMLPAGQAHEVASLHIESAAADRQGFTRPGRPDGPVGAPGGPEGARGGPPGVGMAGGMGMGPGPVSGPTAGTFVLLRWDRPLPNSALP